MGRQAAPRELFIGHVPSVIAVPGQPGCPKHKAAPHTDGTSAPSQSSSRGRRERPGYPLVLEQERGDRGHADVDGAAIHAVLIDPHTDMYVFALAASRSGSSQRERVLGKDG